MLEYCAEGTPLAEYWESIIKSGNYFFHPESFRHSTIPLFQTNFLNISLKVWFYQNVKITEF